MPCVPVHNGMELIGPKRQCSISRTFCYLCPGTDTSTQRVRDDRLAGLKPSHFAAVLAGALACFTAATGAKYRSL